MDEIDRRYRFGGGLGWLFVAWLEKSYAVRQADLVSIKIDPNLDRASRLQAATQPP